MVLVLGTYQDRVKTLSHLTGMLIFVSSLDSLPSFTLPKVISTPDDFRAEAGEAYLGLYTDLESLMLG